MRHTSKVKCRVGLLMIAYVALILHAFVPHHHHFDDLQIFVGTTSDCHNHHCASPKQFVTDDDDYLHDTEHNSHHLPGECSTIQHSLNTLSYSYDSDDFVGELSKFPWIGLVFQNFVLESTCLDTYVDYPIPEFIAITECLLFSTTSFRGPPAFIS